MFTPLSRRQKLLPLLLAISAIAAPRYAAAQSSVARGQRWEQTINASATQPWTTKLCVQYTSPTNKVYTGAGFWDTRVFQQAPAPDTDNFKIRAAFNELGTWSWLLINNPDPATGCVSTAGFSPASGTISVSGDTTGLPLYATGPVRVNTSPRFLHYSGAGILSPFHWIGDTTWSGAHRTYRNPGWNNYITDRKNKSYTVIQIAVPLGASEPVDVVNRRPFGVYDANDVLQPCPTGVLPRASCVPNKLFWDYWDLHVNDVNAQGMLAAVIGLFKRTNESQNWPTIADSEGYARWVAARLAGNYTALAPGFDELPKGRQTFTGSDCGNVNPNPPNEENQACRAREVGAAIREAILLQTTIDVPALPASRQGAPLTALVTHHIGGGCPSDPDIPPGACLADFWLDRFQDETWLDFQLFQSGQGKNCDFDGDGIFDEPGEQLACLTQRSSTRPRTLYDANPIKPIINGEAIYDNNGRESCTVNNSLYGELRARQAAFNSLLSGSVGFTHGVGGTWDWGGYATCRSVADGTNAESSTQIGRLKLLFQPFRWNRLLPDCQLWNNACTDIKNSDQPGLPVHLKRMFARDSLGTFAIGFLPDNQGFPNPFEASLRLDLSDLAGFTNAAPWSTDWYNPRRPVSAGGPCYCTATATPAGANWNFVRPAFGDWGLVIRNTTNWPNLAVPACNPPVNGVIPC